MTDPRLYGMLKIWRVIYIVLFALNVIFIREIGSPLFTAISSVVIAFFYIGNHKSIKDIENFNKELMRLNELNK